MELFELVLVLLACVIASSVLEQVFTRVSLPLVQIAVGLVVALVMPRLGEVHVEAELFLVLFIAPLLFNEAFEADARLLWRNKGAILSLAIALVLATVLAMGFMLNYIVPSIPLAAAFACAAALGPTDAAAVAALGSTVSLSSRQKSLLSGEALINDASGVVSFQFAIAAAVTGAFSLADASATFAVLFFGGIAVGVVMGFLARFSIDIVRMRGFENTTVRVVYEVFTPFVVFLAAEEIHVSGILAVVAAGLIMAQRRPRLASTADAHHRMVASSVWEVIIFLINGVIFVMLGMQLPICIGPILDEGMSPALLLLLIVLMTCVIVGMRFAWLAVMEMTHVDDATGKRGPASFADGMRDALVTTIAGPKGAVTLSIILTMPLFTESGAAFPARDLLIFLTASTILATLLLANFVLPVIARKPEGVADGGRELAQASVKVYAGTIEELSAKIASGTHPEYEPATRLAIARYRTRLARTRLTMEGSGEVLTDLILKVLDVQQARADEIQAMGRGDGKPYTAREAAPYHAVLRGIRASVGYFNNAEKVGARSRTLRGRLALLRHLIHPHKIEDEKAERIYYDTCLFAIDLENTAIEFLEGQKGQGDAQRDEVVNMLIEEHHLALSSLWGRINFEQDDDLEHATDLIHARQETLPEGMRRTFAKQFEQAREYAAEVNAGAFTIELDQIRSLRERGEISEDAARKLREDVYLLQMQMQLMEE